MFEKINYSKVINIAALLSSVLLTLALLTTSFSNHAQIVLLYITIFLVYTSVIIYIGKKYNLFEILKNVNIIWFFICITLAGNLFVYAYITNQKHIKYWDVAGYWKGTIYFSQKINEHLKGAMFYLYDTINNDSYNALPCFFSAEALNVIGKEFVKYVITNYNLYIIPFYFVFTLLIAKVLKNNNIKPERPLVYIIIASFFFTSILVPCMLGFLDGIGLLYIGLLMIFVYEDTLSKKDWKSLLLTVFLLVVMGFTRRWYLFWVVAFFPSYFIAGVIKLITDKSYNRKSLITLAVNLMAVGLTYIGLLYFFFNGFFKRSLFNNYSDIYSGYKWGGYMENLYMLILYFSIPIVIIAIIGAYTGIKNKASRSLSIMLLIQLAIIFFLFVNIESFSLVHYYLIAPGILYFMAMGIATIFVIPKWGKYLATALALLLGLSFTHTFFHWPFTKSDEKLSYLFSSIEIKVLNRPDIKQIEAIVDYLNDLSNNETKKVYLLASSHVINDDILKDVYLPDNQSPIKGLSNNHSHVDKTHGFPQELLGADIVVVADPIQYHMRAEDQKVVGIPAEEILSGRGIGKAYKLLKEFQIMDDIKLKVYQKVNAYSIGAIDTLINIFKTSYSDYPNLYTINFYPAIVYGKAITDGYSGIVFYNNYRSVYIHPGDSAPTSFKMGLDKGFSKIIVQASFKDPDQIAKSCGNNGGEVFLRIYMDKKLILEKYLTCRDTSNIELNTAGVNELKFEVDKANKNASCDGFQLENIELIK